MRADGAGKGFALQMMSRVGLRTMVQDRSAQIDRWLAAILAADVAGYSRLMHADEEGTHTKLTALMADVVYPAIAEHGGRILQLPAGRRERQITVEVDAISIGVEHMAVGVRDCPFADRVASVAQI
jgi:class 3 adenylate cyclase